MIAHAFKLAKQHLPGGICQKGTEVISPPKTGLDHASGLLKSLHQTETEKTRLPETSKAGLQHNLTSLLAQQVWLYFCWPPAFRTSEAFFFGRTQQQYLGEALSQLLTDVRKSRAQVCQGTLTPPRASCGPAPPRRLGPGTWHSTPRHDGIGCTVDQGLVQLSTPTRHEPGGASLPRSRV